MIHTFSVVLELTYDDLDGQYPAPTTNMIETRLLASMYQTLNHMGFDEDYFIEAAKGALKEAFGVGE